MTNPPHITTTAASGPATGSGDATPGSASTTAVIEAASRLALALTVAEASTMAPEQEARVVAHLATAISAAIAAGGYPMHLQGAALQACEQVGRQHGVANVQDAGNEVFVLLRAATALLHGAIAIRGWGTIARSERDAQMAARHAGDVAHTALVLNADAASDDAGETLHDVQVIPHRVWRWATQQPDGRWREMAAPLHDRVVCAACQAEAEHAASTTGPTE